MIVCPKCDRDLGDSLAAGSQLQCSACCHVLKHGDAAWDFLHHSEVPSAVESSYTDNYEQIAVDDLNDSILNETYADIQAKKLFSYLGPLRSTDVCDLGIGQGRVLRRLVESEARSVTGVDIASTYLKQFRDTRARLFLANAEDLPFRHEFDVVVCSDILEHVLNLGDTLISVNRSLKIGGRFLVRVPFRENLLHYARKRGCPYPFVHLRSFNRSLLRDVLQQSGFRVTRFRFDGFYADRPRKAFSRLPLNLVLQMIARLFGDPNKVTAINNKLGCAVMKPIEIVADARKVEEADRAA